MEFFNKFSLKTKIIALCLFMSAIGMTIGTMAYRGLNKVEDTYDAVVDDVMPKLEDANDMFVHFRRIRITLRTLGLPGITAKQGAEAIQETEDYIAAFEESEKKYFDRGFSEGQKELYAKLHADWANFKEVGARALALYKKGTPESLQEMVQIFFTECPDAANKFTVSMTDLLNFHKKTAAAQKVSAKNIGDDMNVFIVLIAIIGIFSGLAIGFVVAVSVSKSILKVSKNLSQNAKLVSSASTEIASSSENLSSASAQQVASLEETASSLEEITAMINKAAENAKLAAQSSNSSQAKAEEGRAAVENVMNSMDEISESNLAIVNQVNESNSQMFEIVKVIQEIGHKTKVINEIVFQTKLLSFNASVEAARAGQHGKGFAVVAEEVGKLAQMSGNAAKEISEMLDGSVAKVEGLAAGSKTKVESLVELGKRKVEVGVNVARKCSEVLNEIVSNVSKVSSLAQEISQATEEQARGVNEINRAMGQLDIVTQNNTTSSAEAATAAASLSSQAESLKSSVDELSVTIEGAVAFQNNYAA